MSLLFLAMYNLLEEKIIISEDESLKDQIYEDFLVDKYQPQEKRMKLKPIKNDQKHLVSFLIVKMIILKIQI